MTAKTTPSAIPADCAATDKMTVFRAPSRIRCWNWYRRTTSKSMKWARTADSTSHTARSRTTPAEIHRPQCRTGTALTASGSAAVTLPWLAAAVERGGLQRPPAHAPLGEDAVVGAVGDDCPERCPQRVAELRLLLGHGDAVLADHEAGLADDLE